MANKIYYQTITPLLKEALEWLMNTPAFNSFRLVGGTALSLQRGHRTSVDIDLFTDAQHGSLNFELLEQLLQAKFPHMEKSSVDLIGLGRSYFAGYDENNLVKIDLYYTDPFIFPPVSIDGIRMASIEEIIAMKMDVIQRTGRKKDFWDIHELLSDYSLSEMIVLHESRYPYIHDRALLINQLSNFSEADNDFDPVCLRGNYWTLIKEDILDEVNMLK